VEKRIQVVVWPQGVGALTSLEGVVSMNGRIARILELAEITGRKNDPKLRRLLRSLMLRPNPRLEEALLRQLTLQAKDEAFDPSPFRMPSEDELVVPGSEGMRYVAWGRVAKLSGDAIATGHVFRLPLVCEHRIFTGMARKGKSVAVAQFLKAILS